MFELSDALDVMRIPCDQVIETVSSDRTLAHGYFAKLVTSADSTVTKQATTTPSTTELVHRHDSLGSQHVLFDNQAKPESLHVALDGHKSNTAHDTQTQQEYLGISSTFDFTTDACRKDIDAITTSYKQASTLR